MDFVTLSLKIGRSEHLPVLPNVVVKLLQMYGSETVSSRLLEHVVAQDPGLTTRVLKVAGSAAYGIGPTADLRRAITLIGIEQIKRIAVNIGYQQFMNNASFTPSFDRLVFWTHCKATATASREVMMFINPAKVEEAYVGGLVHDLGFLAMERFAPLQLDRAIEAAITLRAPIIMAEQQLIGYTHVEVGEVVAKRWDLAPVLTDCITNHNQPFSSTVDAEVCLAVAVGNSIAYEMGYSPIKGVPSMIASQDFIEAINMSAEAIQKVKQVVEHEIQEIEAVLGTRRVA